MKRLARTAPTFELPEVATLRDRMPDTSDVRARVMAAVEEALDRAEDAWHELPSPQDAIERGRAGSSRAGELVTSVVMSAAPVAASLLHARIRSKGLRRAARVAPWAMRSHPVALGASAIGGIALGVGITKRLRSRAAQGVHGAPAMDAATEQQAAQMDAEGASPGAYDQSPMPLRRVVQPSERA